ncbi:hypothetical protein MTR_8g470100 [Medicago truncatula]|uniref:Uncharacterized protein n=1 Tax=Medicago truncatula TaxID=3880 RepID=A0A072TSU6_MEDTR|nr:hypothetical protein MTR_8g470100 [Medicago truncatula]
MRSKKDKEMRKSNKVEVEVEHEVAVKNNLDLSTMDELKEKVPKRSSEDLEGDQKKGNKKSNI